MGSNSCGFWFELTSFCYIFKLGLGVGDHVCTHWFWRTQTPTICPIPINYCVFASCCFPCWSLLLFPSSLIAARMKSPPGEKRWNAKGATQLFISKAWLPFHSLHSIHPFVVDLFFFFLRGLALEPFWGSTSKQSDRTLARWPSFNPTALFT